MLHTTLDTLPEGISVKLFEALSHVAHPCDKHTHEMFWGVTVHCNSLYPITLQDGTVVDGVIMVNDRQKLYWVQSPVGKKKWYERLDSLEQLH